MSVRVYTMPACPFCDRAKALLKQRGIDFEEILLQLDDEPAWEALEKLSKMKTVPVIYRGDRLIGGYSHLAELDRKDKLASLKD